MEARRCYFLAADSLGYNPAMFRRIILTCVLCVFLAACASPMVTLLPTLASLPAASASPLPTATPEPTNSPPPLILSPTAPTVTSTRQPTVAATDSFPSETPQPPVTIVMLPTQGATAVPQPDADAGAIQLLGPGPLSKVVSPLAVFGYALPGYGNKGKLELFGEDGRLLVSELIQLNSIYRFAYFYRTLTFQTGAVGELGRITLSTRDQYGRLSSVYSAHILLLSEGVSLINPPGNLQERCVVERPVVGRHNPGGTLAVTGKMRPFSSQPLTVELITRDGRTIASQQVPITPALDGSYVPFNTSLAYSVSGGTWTQLVVRQDDDRIRGMMYLYSQEIYLLP
jgi:hypothetical protein